MLDIFDIALGILDIVDILDIALAIFGILDMLEILDIFGLVKPFNKLLTNAN